MTLLFACSRGCKSKDEPSYEIKRPKVQQNQENQADKDESDNKYTPYSGGGYSGSSSGDSGYSDYSDYSESVSPPELLSEKEKAKMLKKREENRKKLRANAIEWLKHKTNDPSLCIQTIEKYKIKSHQGFTNGTVALRNKDYNSAIKFFNETVKDANASPVTKYFALSNMMTIAQQTKDVKLYFIAARMSAMLCATEDLSALGIKKDTHQLEWVEKVEKTIYARNDPKYFEECVKLKMDLYEGGVTREDAEEDVRDDIAFYTDLYKEMLE